MSIIDLMIEFLAHSTLYGMGYVGPGLGAGAIAILIGILLSILLGIVGVVYYPLKRILGRKKKSHALSDVPPTSDGGE